MIISLKLHVHIPHDQEFSLRILFKRERNEPQVDPKQTSKTKYVSTIVASIIVIKNRKQPESLITAELINSHIYSTG